MEYVFTKRQLNLISEENSNTEITVGSNSGQQKNITNLQSDLNAAISQNPGKSKFGADSENFNNNTTDTKNEIDVTVTGYNASDMTNNLKQQLKNPKVKQSWENGDSEAHFIKLNNGRYIPKDKLIENRRFTKKQFDRFLKSLK